MPWKPVVPKEMIFEFQNPSLKFKQALRVIGELDDADIILLRMVLGRMAAPAPASQEQTKDDVVIVHSHKRKRPAHSARRAKSIDKSTEFVAFTTSGGNRRRLAPYTKGTGHRYVPGPYFNTPVAKALRDYLNKHHMIANDFEKKFFKKPTHKLMKWAFGRVRPSVAGARILSRVLHVPMSKIKFYGRKWDL